MTAGSTHVSSELSVERQPAGCSQKRLIELLLAAVPEDIDRFERLCGEVSDWEKLFADARAQGVAGVIWYYLAHPGVANHSLWPLSASA